LCCDTSEQLSRSFHLPVSWQKNKIHGLPKFSFTFEDKVEFSFARKNWRGKRNLDQCTYCVWKGEGGKSVLLYNGGFCNGCITKGI
jgi:hypothetical protein